MIARGVEGGVLQVAELSSVMVEKDDAIGDGRQVFVIVRDDDGRLAVLTMRVLDAARDALSVDGIQARGRFVVDHDLRVERERPRHGQTLLLAATEKVRGDVARNSEILEELSWRRFVVAYRSPVVEAELHVRRRTEFIEKGVALEDDAHVDVPVGREAVFAVDGDRAGDVDTGVTLLDQAGQDSEKYAFARPACTDDEVNLAGFEASAGVLQKCALACHNRQVVDGDRVVPRGRGPRRVGFRVGRFSHPEPPAPGERSRE